MIKKILKNSLGFKTNQKIVVIESDDWGFERINNEDALVLATRKKLITNPKFEAYDCLASKRDLMALENVLKSVTDRNSNPAVMSMAFVLTNPDFDKIRDSDFEKYCFETYQGKLKKNGELELLRFWENVDFNPAFSTIYHGREHLNSDIWLEGLRKRDKNLREAFDLNLASLKNSKGVSYLAAYDPIKPSLQNTHEKSLINGLELFEKLFSKRATVFVPPNGPLNPIHHKVLASNGIQGIQTGRLFYSLRINNSKTHRSIRYLGRTTSKSTISYMIRNCFFEPSFRNPRMDRKACLKQIEEVFNYNNPAIISTHRVNYVSGMRKSDLDYGLNELNELLESIVRKWPDVIFYSSDQLLNEIKSKGNK